MPATPPTPTQRVGPGLLPPWVVPTTATVDLGILLALVLAIGADAAALLLAAWAQIAALLLLVPLVLFLAARRAPDDPEVDAGEPVRFGRRARVGRAAARSNAMFFLGHYGLFVVVLYGFVVVLAGTVSGGLPRVITVVVILLRALAIGLPGAVGDLRDLQRVRYHRLAERSNHIVIGAYLRLMPLHITIVGLLIANATLEGFALARWMAIGVALSTAVGTWLLDTPHGSDEPAATSRA